jgi:integrating conjugative element protein (TIGR03756 family)
MTLHCRALADLALLPALGVAWPAPALAIDTARLIASAASLSCLQPRPVGSCFWLVCTPVGCSVETSIKMGHYNPDLVVSATHGLGRLPWDELRGPIGALETSGAGTAIAAAGGRAFGLGRLGGIAGPAGAGPAQPGSNLVFKEAQAIGHPAAGSLYCPSVATPLQPYFLSGLDVVGWRWSLPEAIYPEALVPGLREIGPWPAQTWGPLYPRAGWATQTDPAKAAAILAQRVGDLVTRAGQARIYTPLAPSGGTFTGAGKLAWAPPPLVERRAGTGTWQGLVPRVGSTCGVFGRNDLASATGWGGGQVAADGHYAWALWRPYACCEIKGSYLGHIDIAPFP